MVEERVVQGLTDLHHYNPLYVKVFRRVCRLMVISLITIDEEIRRVDGSVHHHALWHPYSATLTARHIY